MVFENGVKNIQAAAYNGARTVVLNVTYEHICEFKQNRYVRRCIYFFLVFSSGLIWGVPPWGGYGCQGGLLFFVGAFGG